MKIANIDFSFDITVFDIIISEDGYLGCSLTRTDK